MLSFVAWRRWAASSEYVRGAGRRPMFMKRWCCGWAAVPAVARRRPMVQAPSGGGPIFSVRMAAIGAALIAVVLAVGCAGSAGQAAKLEQQGQYAEAIALFQQSAIANPGSDEALEARLKIANIYMTGLKHPEKAVAEYEAIAAADAVGEAGLAARYQLGLHYFRAEEYSQAGETFTEIITAAPTSETGAKAQLMLAKAQERAGQIEDAERTYGAFAALHSDDPNAAIAMETRAKLLDSLDRRSEAIEARQKLVRDYGAEVQQSEVVELAKEGLRIEGASIPQPTTVAAMSDGQRAQMRAAGTRERDRPESAKQAAAAQAASNIFGVSAESIMSQMTVNASDSQGTMYDAMYSMAQVMYLSMDYKAAGALYQRAIELAESEVGSGWENGGAAYKGLADVYRKLGLDQLAHDFLLKAQQKNPRVLDQVIDGATFDYEAGDYETAIATWQSIIGLSPNRDGQLHYYIGLAYKKMGDTPSELLSFERAAAANPKDMDAIQSLAEVLYYRAGQRQRSYVYQDIVDGKPGADSYLDLGLVALREGYYMNAQQQFNLGSRIAGREEKPELEAGMAALKAVAQGKRDEDMVEQATADLAALMEANPDNAMVVYAAGLHAVTLGDMDTAIAHFKTVMEAEPKNARPVRELGKLYIVQDNAKAALEIYTAYVEKNPRDKAILLLRDQLRIQIGAENAPRPTGPGTQAVPSAPKPDAP